MSKVTVVAKLTFQADAIDRVTPELSKLVTATRAEEGCIEYRLYQDNDDPSVFIFYENWENMACLDRHLNSDHFTSYVAAVGHLITERVLNKLSEVG
jgi:quinol monooxygenase YgiN